MLEKGRFFYFLLLTTGVSSGHTSRNPRILKTCFIHSLRNQALFQKRKWGLDHRAKELKLGAEELSFEEAHREDGINWLQLSLLRTNETMDAVNSVLPTTSTVLCWCSNPSTSEVTMVGDRTFEDVLNIKWGRMTRPNSTWLVFGHYSDRGMTMWGLDKKIPCANGWEAIEETNFWFLAPEFPDSETWEKISVIQEPHSTVFCNGSPKKLIQSEGAWEFIELLCKC
jgi:hypothetical protein